MDTDRIDAYTQAIQRRSALSQFHARIERKRGKQKATVAAARKLLHIIYWMLVRNEPYHGHGPNLEAKPAA